VTLAPDYPLAPRMPSFSKDYRTDPYRLGYASATMKGIWNHMRAVDVLQALPEADAARIGCIGHSLGAYNTIFLSAFDKRIRVAVSSAGFNSFFKYSKGDLSGWSHKGHMPRIASVYEKEPKKVPFESIG
jgi:cephalosporin-C deacetylase-like acetyl esterase